MVLPSYHIGGLPILWNLSVFGGFIVLGCLFLGLSQQKLSWDS